MQPLLHWKNNKY